VLVAMFLGHGDFDGHGDSGHTHAHGHDDAHGHDGHHSEFHFPFFSPLALATFLGAIGAWGLIAKRALHAGDSISVAIAIPAAIGTAYAVTFIGWKLVQGSRGSSQVRTQELEGALAEVTTPIPAGGMGEVAAMVGGQRFSGPARSADGQAVERGATVTVQSLIGGTMIVERRLAMRKES
jgi:membrane protein implicated in regulation of membrane protease activity